MKFESDQGLDHVALCVRSLSHAQATFEKLGFQLYPGGKHEEYGTQNSGAWFENDTYVELLTYFDATKASWLVDFLDKQEGALFLVLRVNSAHAMASFFRNRGMDVGDPIPGTWQQDEAEKKVLWHSLFLPRINLPGNVLFFIEYAREEPSYRNKPTHPAHFVAHRNGSKKLRSVWIAVEDLDKAAKEFEDIGFQVGTIEPFTQMNAWKRTIHVGRGNIELICSNDDKSEIVQFLKRRGEGIFGFSIAIEDYAKVRAQLSKDVLEAITYHDKEMYMLIPPQVCHGAWIEFAQE